MSSYESMHVLGALELDSVAAGLMVLDTMVKEAPIAVLEACTVCPGKYVIFVTGAEAAVEASLRAGSAAQPSSALDRLYIPHLHRDVWPAVRGEVPDYRIDAIGVIESFSLLGAVEAGDAAAKAAEVRLIHIRWGNEMGGKSSVKMVGPIAEVQTAIDAGSDLLQEKEYLCNQVIVPRPHEDVGNYLARG